MTQFHKGQEVEVFKPYFDETRTIEASTRCDWRGAKIVEIGLRSYPVLGKMDRQWKPAKFVVQFPDGSRAVFDAEHVRLSKEQVEQELADNGQRFVDSMSRAKKVAHDLGEGLMGRGKYAD
jgi:hypothetical protein